MDNKFVVLCCVICIYSHIQKFLLTGYTPTNFYLSHALHIQQQFLHNIQIHIYLLHVRILILFQTNRSQVSYEPLSEQQKYEIRQQCRRYLEGSLDEIDVCSLYISSILHPVIHTRSPQGESHIHSYSIPDQNTSNKLPHNSAHNTIGNVPKLK